MQSVKYYLVIASIYLRYLTIYAMYLTLALFVYSISEFHGKLLAFLYCAHIASKYTERWLSKDLVDEMLKNLYDEPNKKDIQEQDDRRE